MSNRENRKRANQCVECRKFRAWDDLKVSRFVPDNAFGGEEVELTCGACRETQRVKAQAREGQKVAA